MIEHISFSSLMLFNHNRAAWHSKYILGIHDQLTNPSALLGIGIHKYLELLLRTYNKKISYANGRQLILDTKDVDWGKTGSLEKTLKEYDNTVQTINSELPKYAIHKVIATEMEALTKVPYIKLPIKSFIDLVYEDAEGNTHITDWKTVKSFSDEPTPTHIIQMVIYYWMVQGALKVDPKTATIAEIKVSKNKDGSPQIKYLTINYEEHPEYFKATKHFVQETVKEMLKKRQYMIPNLRDGYEGEAEWKRYLTHFTN